MIEHINCPLCGRRLFDIDEPSEGKISIKCVNCKKVAQLKLGSKKNQSYKRQGKT